MERYNRRWNLHLYELPEQEGEDVKQRIMEVCKRITPDSDQDPRIYIDVSHRNGRKEANKNRPVIIRFISRSVRDHVWKSAKGSEFLKIKKMTFGEDLTSKNKELRNKLWPQIEEARKQGKPSYFIGSRAFIDGKEIKPVE